MRAVNSVLNQTYRNIELIVVDDCSTDNTKEILNEIKDDRLKYFCLEKNSGACAARNRGINEAKGEIIAFNDSDDEWHNDKLLSQFSFMQENDADIVVSSMAVYDEELNTFLFNFPDSKKTKEGQVTYEDLLCYNCTSTQLMFGKAVCFKENPFDSLIPRFQDWEEALRLSKKYKLFHHDKILVNTFIQKDSITKNPQKALKAFEILYEKNKEAIEPSPKIKAAFFKKKSGFVWRCGQNPKDELKIVWQNERTLKNFIQLTLARLNLYRMAARILRK